MLPIILGSHQLVSSFIVRIRLIKKYSVRKLVVDGICTQLVDPHRIAVPLAAKCASKYRWPQPKNVWRITVVEAENLVNADAV